MLVVLILKIKYLNKRNENEELACICKTIYLEFTNIKDDCYIIPTITINKYLKTIDIEFKWLNISYINSWKIISNEEENIYINSNINKNK